MSGSGFDAQPWAAALIALITATAIARLWLWARAAPASARPSRGRLGLLVGLNLAAGLLLHLTLFPPGATLKRGVLVVATAGAPEPLELAPGETLVALPEAGAIKDAAPAPDLATALRRAPGAARIRVEGEGLAPRDQAPLPLPLDFDPPPPPRGLVDLALPEPAAPGAVFAVGGQIGSLAVGTVDLADPAGAVVGRTRVVTGGRFVLTGMARAAGPTLFELRLRDAAGLLVERVAVPVDVRDQTQPRVLVLAGAPNAEIKYLRRWAQDAGIDLDARIDVGGGVQVGDAAPPLTRASLSGIDLLVIDDRRWEALDAGAQATLAAAVDGGLGLLLRPTGPLSAATRRDWSALGLPLTGGDDSLPVLLDPPSPAPGEEGEDASQAQPAAPSPQPLSRRDLAPAGPGVIATQRAADGSPLAAWRARGQGRVGVWIVPDSYALVLTGRADRYGDLWSGLFSTLARAGQETPVRVEGVARLGVRIPVCRIPADAVVVTPDGRDRPLIVDPKTGEARCAAFWPDRTGWHVVRAGKGTDRAFYVHPADAAPALAAAQRRQATLDLAAMRPVARAAADAPRTPGSPWPWAAGLLLALAGLWWLERNRRPSTLSREEKG